MNNAGVNGPDRDTTNKFLDDLTMAQNIGIEDGEDMPAIEADRVIIEHYNNGKQALKAFDKIGYFIVQGVKVYERGKRPVRKEVNDA